MKKHFYIEDYYIFTKNDDNWDAIKWMLDIPIWERTNKKPSKDYKEYKMELREIQNKKRRTDKQKEKDIKELIEKRAESMDEIVTTTHRTFLRAFGDLMCERGDPHSISSPDIKKKFMELACEEYDDYIEEQFQIISKRIEQSKDMDKEQKEKLRNKERKKIKQRIKKLEKKHLNRVKQMTGNTGLKPVKRINSLNNWLNSNCCSQFVKKVGENYKLLVYYATGSGETEYFCSDKNKEIFINFIIKRKEKIIDFKDLFDSHNSIKNFENDLNASYKEDEYFRRGGPVKYHFEKGLMVKREKVNEILKDFTDENDPKYIQLLKGGAASGKTVISRFIGYDFLKKGWNVYRIAIEEIKLDDVRDVLYALNYLENTAKNNLVLIEDLHKKDLVSISLIEGLTNINRKTKYLLTTRNELWDNFDYHQHSIIDRCEIRELTKEDFKSDVKEIIKNFFNHQIKNIEEEFNKNFNENCNNIIKKSKNNLWLVSYFLKAWMPNKGIDLDSVYENIYNDINKLSKEFKRYNLNGVPETLLTIAPFSMFEIGVCRSFLHENFDKINVNPKTLEKLEEYGEIKEINGFYYVTHSTLAQLYIETALYNKNKTNYNYLLNDIIKTHSDAGLDSQYSKYPMNSFHIYLQSKPMNYGDVILQLALFEYRSPYDTKIVNFPYFPNKVYRDILITYTIIPNLTYNYNTLNSMINIVNESENLHNIGQILFGAGISKATQLYQELINGIEINDLAVKIKNSELNDITRLFSYMIFVPGKSNTQVTKLFFKSLRKKIEIEDLKIKLKSEASFIDRLAFISNFAKISLFTKEDLIGKFNDIIFENVNIDIDITRLNSILQNMDVPIYGYDTYKMILNKLSHEIIFKSFNIETDLANINNCIPTFGWKLFSHEKYKNNFIELLSSKIKTEERISVIINCICIIGAGDPNGDIIKKIISGIDKNSFKSKIDDNSKQQIIMLLRNHSLDKKIIRLILNDLDLWKFMTKKEQTEINEIINSKRT